MTFPVHHCLSVSYSAYNLYVTIGVVEITKDWVMYKAKIDILRHFSEPRLRQQAGTVNLKKGYFCPMGEKKFLNECATSACAQM